MDASAEKLQTYRYSLINFEKFALWAVTEKSERKAPARPSQRPKFAGQMSNSSQAMDRSDCFQRPWVFSRNLIVNS